MVTGLEGNSHKRRRYRRENPSWMTDPHKIRIQYFLKLTGEFTAKEGGTGSEGKRVKRISRKI